MGDFFSTQKNIKKQKRTLLIKQWYQSIKFPDNPVTNSVISEKFSKIL